MVRLFSTGDKLGVFMELVNLLSLMLWKIWLGARRRSQYVCYVNFQLKVLKFKASVRRDTVVLCIASIVGVTKTRLNYLTPSLHQSKLSEHEEKEGSTDHKIKKGRACLPKSMIHRALLTQVFKLQHSIPTYFWSSSRVSLAPPPMCTMSSTPYRIPLYPACRNSLSCAVMRPQAVLFVG